MRTLLPALLIAAALAGGCGGNESTTEPSSAAGPSGGQAAGAPITADDIAAYERGIRKEVEAVRAAQQQAAAATDADARGRAMQAQWDTATIPQGAEAAGLDEARYRTVRATIHEVLRTLDFQGKIEGPLTIDLERVDAATRERLSRDPLAELPPDSASALRAALPRLTPPWVEYVKLTAVAG